MDRTMLRIGAMNMLWHGVDNPNISYRDSLSEQNADNEKYSLVLANPPFKGSLDYEAVSADLLKVTKMKKTELLLFTKTGSGRTDQVWFYDMKADGYSLDDKRQEISDCNIPDIISRFNNLEAETDRARTEQSFFVPVDEIVSNDYDLSVNKYKEIVYEKVEYEPTDVILGRIEQLEARIQEEMAELKQLLGK